MAMTQSGANARADKSPQEIDFDTLEDVLDGISELLTLAVDMARARYDDRREFELLCHLISAIRAQVEKQLAVVGAQSNFPLESVSKTLEDAWLTLDHALDSASEEFEDRRTFDLFCARLNGASASMKLMNQWLAGFDETLIKEAA